MGTRYDKHDRKPGVKPIQIPSDAAWRKKFKVIQDLATFGPEWVASVKTEFGSFTCQSKTKTKAIKGLLRKVRSAEKRTAFKSPLNTVLQDDPAVKQLDKEMLTKLINSSGLAPAHKERLLEKYGIPPTKFEGLLEEFNEAAMSWGYQSSEGSGREVNKAKHFYEEAKAALVSFVEDLENEVKRLEKEVDELSVDELS